MGDFHYNVVINVMIFGDMKFHGHLKDTTLNPNLNIETEEITERKLLRKDLLESV